MEFHINKRSVSRFKLHCSFLEHSRVFNKPWEERSFDIFYQMIAGLSDSEKMNLEISNMTADDFNYLNCEKNMMTLEEDSRLFKEWKNSVENIGANFSDIMRVLSALLLIGNIYIDRETEVEKVSKLLSIKKEVLIRGLTTRTQKIRGEVCTRKVDKRVFESSKKSLAASLYTRTVNTLVKRINCLNPRNSLNYEKSPKPCSLFILDSFGLQRSDCGLEKLCMNLCTETLQVRLLLVMRGRLWLIMVGEVLSTFRVSGNILW